MQSGVKRSATEAYQRCGLQYIPNPMQEEMYNAITSGDCAVLLKAPTGSGKMEAVVVPVLYEERRLVLIYPALSLIEDQELRLEKMLCALSVIIPNRPHTLVVDTGADMYRRTWLNGAEQTRARRHLYHGDIILTTLDKFLYRFFGFGEPKKSYTYPLRLRYGRQPLFCFDEAHSYDDVAYTNFVDLVRTIGFNADAPRDIVVMTATMPPAYEADLRPLLTSFDYTAGERSDALARYYAEVNPRRYPEKALTYLPVSADDQNAFCQQIISLLEDYHQQGQRTIITVEKVETTIALYRLLSERGASDVLLYHGRQPHPLRRSIYATLKQWEDEDKGYLLVTTSAIEVGCDLNAQVLISQLCNPEQLVQRAGRCNRRGIMEAARIIVLGNHIPEYVRTLANQRDVEQYLAVLQEMTDQDMFEAAKLITFRRKYVTPDYRVQTMFSMLYEYVYQAERANKPLHDKGLVVTRSWEPTVTLTTSWDERWKLQDELQVSMLRCIAKNPTQLDGQCEVFVRYYDETEEQYKFEPPRRGGCAYHQDIVIRLPASYVDPVIGYEHVPKVFLRGRSRQGYRRWLSALVEKPEIPLFKQAPTKKASKKSSKGSSAANTTRENVWWWFLDKLPSTEEDIQSSEVAEESEMNGNEGDAKEYDHE